MLYYISVKATAMDRGKCFQVCFDRLCHKRETSGPAWGNFPQIWNECPLAPKYDLVDFIGSGSRTPGPHTIIICPILDKSQKCPERISITFLQTSTWTPGWTYWNVSWDRHARQVKPVCWMYTPGLDLGSKNQSYTFIFAKHLLAQCVPQLRGQTFFRGNSCWQIQSNSSRK